MLLPLVYVCTPHDDTCPCAAPVADKPLEEPPPFVVLVQGPPGVGKSLLIRCLVKHFSKQTIVDMRGPITVVAGKARRLTFVECPQVARAVVNLHTA